MPAIQTTFVDLTTVVPAAWFNRLQKHLAGYMNLKVTVSGTAVQVTAAELEDQFASVYIGGQMRRNDTNASVTISGVADTYNVYAVATAAVDTFALEFSATTPATSPYRKIAEVDWDGAAITALRGVERSRVPEHTHDGYAYSQIDHADVTGSATGDPHTSLTKVDATRAYTGTVGGVSPVAAADLATKAYADGLLLTVPVGSVFWWPSDDAVPSGFLECNGAAVSRSTHAALFALIGETYGNGDGSTTFNTPNVKGRFVKGSGDGSVGATGGGLLTHTHTQPSHSHTQDSHSHTSPTHTHTGGTTGTSGSHTHTQGSTGSSGSHTHSQPLHSHGDGSISVGTSSGASFGGRGGDNFASGGFSETDLDNASSSHSHRHGDGGYSASGVPVSGNTDYRDPSDHTHPPAGNAYEHTHPGGAVSGSTNTTSSTTSSNGSHTHTNPTTASGGSHTHSSGGNTGTAAPTTANGGDVSSGISGGDDTGSATYPYVTARAIIYSGA